MKSSFFSLIIALMMMAMVGCGSAEYTVVSRPARPAFVRPASPGPGYVWYNGNWVWRGGRYEWENGYWSAPRPERWHNGHWRKVRGGWNWAPGYWR